MAQDSILVNMDKNTFREIHVLMGMQLEVDGVVVYRMTEAVSKQQFYRELFRAGMDAKIKQFEKKKKELKDESQDNNRE